MRQFPIFNLADLLICATDLLVGINCRERLEGQDD